MRCYRKIVPALILSISLLALPSLGLAQGTSNGAGGGPVTSPLGAAQSSPTLPVSVVEPDGFNACSGGNACTLVGATGTLALQDGSAYQSATVTILANASGNTITFDESDDPTFTTSSNVPGILVSNPGNAVTASSTLSTTVGVAYQISIKQRYIRIRETAGGVGTTTIALVLHKTAGAIPLPPVTLAGPLGPQTQAASVAVTLPTIDPCQNSAVAKSSAIINITSAATTALVPVSGATTVYVCGFSMSISQVITTANTLVFEQGTGAACATSPIALTGLFGAGGITAAQPIVVTAGGSTVFKTAASNGLCALTAIGATGSFQGVLTFVQI